jgi:hypothetical protein
MVCEFAGRPIFKHEYPLEGPDEDVEGKPVTGQPIGRQWAEEVKAAIDELSLRLPGVLVDERFCIRFETRR